MTITTQAIHRAAWHLLSATLGCWLSLAHADDYVPTVESVQQVEGVSQRAVASLSSLFPNGVRAVVVDRPEPTPMGALVTRAGQCIIVINRTGPAWAQWHFFFERGQLTADEVYEFAALHEIGHCVNKLYPQTVSGLPLKSGRDSETYSDLFALAYMAQTRDAAQMQRIVDSVIRIREGFESFFSSSHATAGAIQRAYAELMGNVAAQKSVTEVVVLSADLYRKAG